MNRINITALVFHIVLALSISSCAALPPLDQLREQGFSPEVVQGQTFRHMVIRKNGKGKLLHIYLEGDGRPWQHSRRISLDPTPSNRVALELFALDKSPSLYLGRPCYWMLKDPACNPRWWTSHRYSYEVVSSLNKVIDTYSSGFNGVVLIGHSGGGSLAMLLAARRDDVKAVTTLAGNLDVAAWTAAHGYSALTGSLNPASEPPLPANIRQYHLRGSLDTTVTDNMIRPTVSKQENARLLTLKGIDHSCCWTEIWPEFLENSIVVLSH